jgi:Flp pilus assembly protein TadD
MGNLWPVSGAVVSLNNREGSAFSETSVRKMMTKKNAGAFSAMLLIWAVVPLLIFLLAGWVTEKIVTAKRDAEGKHYQQTVDASLKKLDSGDRAGAVEGLVRAGQMASGDMAQQTGLIPKFMALGEHKLAAEAIERSLRTAPKERQTAQIYAGLGEYLLNHDDLVNAKRILLGDLMVRWPDALQTVFLQGEVALRGATGKDDIAAAVKLFQKCLALNPGDVPAQAQLGIAYSRLGELDNAEPLLRAALQKQPFDPVVLERLGEVLRQKGKPAEATKYLDEHQRISALQERRKQLEGQYALKKYQPADLLELVRIYEQLGESARAASTLRAYTHLKPADADGQRELAQVCLKLNDQAGARVATGQTDALVAARRP